MEIERELRIEQKIDKLADRISSVDVTLAAQHVSLVEHVRRCDLLEQKLQPLERTHTITVFCAKVVAVVGSSEIALWLAKHLLRQ